MTRNGWHIQQDSDALTLARRIPARFDVRCETRLPSLRRRALAHEIRKDLWRALRDVPGFSPTVRLETADDGLRVIAGGRLDRPAPIAPLQSQISGLLADPERRERWINHTCRNK